MQKECWMEDLKKSPPKSNLKKKDRTVLAGRSNLKTSPPSPLTCLDSANEGLAEVPPHSLNCRALIKLSRLNYNAAKNTFL